MPLEPGNEEKMADRHAVASGEDEKRHDENSMNDVHNGKRGPETASEERPDKLRKTERFEQHAPNTSSSSTMHVYLEYLASEFRSKLSIVSSAKWTKESFHQRSVGLESRRRCWKSQEK